MIKLVVTDMDGTLLDGQGAIPRALPEVLDALHERGILFAVASGRQYQNLRGIFAAVAERIAFIAENGAVVAWHDQIISETTIDPAQVARMVAMGRQARDAGFETLLCGADAAWHETWTPAFQESVIKYYARVNQVERFETVPEAIVKVCYWHPTGPMEALHGQLGTFPVGIKSVVSGFNYLDCLPDGVNKGLALRAVQRQFGISPAETMVFGDYLNDLEMMAEAEHSHAMANSHPDILAAARFRAPANTENGVIRTICEKVLGKTASCCRD